MDFKFHLFTWHSKLSLCSLPCLMILSSSSKFAVTLHLPPASHYASPSGCQSPVVTHRLAIATCQSLALARWLSPCQSLPSNCHPSLGDCHLSVTACYSMVAAYRSLPMAWRLWPVGHPPPLVIPLVAECPLVVAYHLSPPTCPKRR